MKKMIILSLALSLVAVAKPNLPMGDMKEKIAQMAGEKGAFAQEEDFPKAYFLIPHNLPYMVGLTLHHTESSTLELTKKQIETIKGIKEKTVPSVIQSAKKIKDLELSLVDALTKGAEKSALEAKVDEIAALKAALTKSHITCITSVLALLSPKQKEILFAYATKSKEKHKAHANSELISLAQEKK